MIACHDHFPLSIPPIPFLTFHLTARLQSLLQGLRIPRDKPSLVPLRHRNQTRRISAATDGMAIHVVMLLDSEAIQKAQRDEVQLPICQEGPGAHAITDAICEDLCVGLLHPAFRSEDFRVRPNIRVCQISSLISFSYQLDPFELSPSWRKW